MSWNTPAQLANLIGLTLADFDDGEDRFQRALDEANSEVVFRLSVYRQDSYAEPEPYNTAVFTAAEVLKVSAEWKKAGSTLYGAMAELETEFGDAGNIEGTPDGFNLGAFTPNRLEVAGGYKQRGDKLSAEFEAIMGVIAPKTNLPYLSDKGGRADYTDDATYFGRDEWT